MPRILTNDDVADFRERLCEAAERLFAQQGPQAVSMRQLAAELEQLWAGPARPRVQPNGIVDAATYLAQEWF